MGKDKGQTNDEDKSRAQIHQPFGPLVGRIQLARAHAFAHQHGGGIGEARKEADHQTLQRAEYGGGGNRLLRLTAQHHVHDHVADADQNLVHQNGKALMEVFRHKGLGPDEVLGNAEQIGVLLDFAKQQNDQNVHCGSADRGQRRAPNAHGRQAETAENQQPVQNNVGRHGGNRAVQRNAHTIRCTQ